MIYQAQIDKVRELAATGLRPPEIAKVMGVSRQWVYVICSKNDIPYPGRGAPLPEVRTGILTPLNSTLAGTVSELLVASDLLTKGYQVYRPIMLCRGHDLIALSKSGKILTFEVRSAKRRENGTIAASTKNDCNSAYFAFVIAGEPIVYKPELPTK